MVAQPTFDRPADAVGAEAHLLRDLTAYAQAQVAAGVATEALRVVDAGVPDLVAAYGIGYLPLTYREALPLSARPLLVGRRLAGCLWLPATDAQGAVVDALAIYVRPNGGAYVRWCAEPQGMLGATIATSFPDLIVTDNVRVLARCFQRGLRHTLLLRSVADAALQAPRLLACGVRRVEVRVCRTPAAYAEVLRAAGFEVRTASYALDAGAGYFVTPPAPLPPELAPESDPHGELVDDQQPAPVSSPAPAPTEPLAVVHHDRRHGIATLRAGGITYVVEVPTDGRTLLDVTVRHAGAVQRDRFDLAVPEARTCFASVAAARCGVPPAAITAHLTEAFELIRTLVEEDAPPSRPTQPLPSPVDNAVVAEWLAAGDLLDRIATDLDALGWVGEDTAKRLAYLVAISRKLPTPLWCQRLMPAGITGSGIDLIADLTPPEDMVRVSRLTAAMLDRQEPDSLRHALLVADDGEAIADDAVLALRILRDRGVLGVAYQRQPGAGSARPAVAEVRGPIALFTATTRRLDESLTAACLSLPLDESPAQTQRIITTQGRAYVARGTGCAAADVTRATIRARHHALQRALTCSPVIIACADRIEFPAQTVQDRRDHTLFLGIIAAHALLHQHQRAREGTAVVADERDVAAAITLAVSAGIGTQRSLSSAASDLLRTWQQCGHDDLTVQDVLDLHGDWTPYAARSTMAELVEAGYAAVAAGGGQGRRCVFQLKAMNATPTATGSRIQLAASPAVHGPDNLSTLERSSKGVTPEARCG